ncbi:50S ribosomal protein L25 [Nymphaea thermarum]|nr:50S ribosomal protein L25 [Nymphaea thermarum]
MRLSPTLLRRSIGLRFLSQSLAEAPSPCSDGTTVPLTYLEGFPKPDPKYSETILGIPREKSGRLISAKERKAGRVPSIVFEQADGEHGGNKRLISVQTKQMKKLITQLGQSFFLSRLFDLEVRPDFESDEIIEKVRVLPRRMHLHSGTDEVLNVTFMRAPSGAKFKVNVPLLYRGEDACPGLRKGAYLNTIRRTVPFLCPADIVPPYIDVDLSELDVGQKLVMKDLKVHPAISLYQVNEDWPICNVRHGRGSGKKSEQKK